MDERIKKLAYNLVHYSCKVKEGDKVYVHFIGEATQDLARAVIKEVYQAKGLPFPHYTSQQVQREMLLGCSEEQLRTAAEVDCLEMSKMDCYIGIRGTDNVSELSDVPPIRWRCMRNFIPHRCTMISACRRHAGSFCVIQTVRWHSCRT